jgi:hypothetical protein
MKMADGEFFTAAGVFKEVEAPIFLAAYVRNTTASSLYY